MDVTVPVYVEERKAGSGTRFTVRPLFFPEPVEEGELLSRALARLGRSLRRALDGLGRAPDQRQLARWTWAPTSLAEHRADVAVELRRHTVRGRALVVTFEALDRRVGLVPEVGVWFDVPRGQRVPARAQEVLEEHFRRLERQEGDSLVLSPDLLAAKRAWVTTVELDVASAPKLPEADLSGFLMLGSPAPADGRAELHRVGRCLDWLYPEELERVVLREAEVTELASRLAADDRRPVALIGRRRAGRTAIVHECVYRRVEEAAARSGRAAAGGGSHLARRNVWLLAPQRLISGMSFVGQWEDRLLAIVREAERQDHVLYFDDLLGLYAAGITGRSDLSAAHVLRPLVERRRFRLLAEMTPEQWNVLRERDRAMADLLHVLPVREMGVGERRRALVQVMRRLEDRHRCLIDGEVLGATIDLQERYVREEAFPGKAAAFLSELAVRRAGQGIGRPEVIEAFGGRSGLSVAFLDDRRRLERADVARFLSERVVGQPAAVEALADAVVTAKARLNDPGRPLGTFLFLGPTGVGKTRCAKALAEYLFAGDAASRLVRFDMNEFGDGSAVSRLVGTFREPEGLLTAAVRRQPFCVLLLDEIEKGDPGIFDLLLQVLGEGRLTDGRGRTADFTGAVVILTSNLGTREAAARFGLRPRDLADDALYVAAAERHFRPEFFNRLDRIVPFAKLDRTHMRAIARQAIADVFAREGLAHRRCTLEVDAGAMERLVEVGFDPELGARALKRCVERELAQPVARRLAAMAPGAPAVISVYPGRGESGLAVSVQELAETPRLDRPAVDLSDPLWLLDRAEDALDRIERRQAEGADAAAAAGRLTQGQIAAAQFRYLAVREQASRVRGMVGRLDRALAARSRRPGAARVPPTAAARAPRRAELLTFKADWRDLVAAEHLASHLAELAPAPATPQEASDERLRQELAELTEELALLETMATTAGPREGAGADADADADAGAGDRVVVEFRRIGVVAMAVGQPTETGVARAAAAESRGLAAGLRSLPDLLAEVLQRLPGASVERWPKEGGWSADGTAWVMAEFPAAPALLAGEAGVHVELAGRRRGGASHEAGEAQGGLVQVTVTPLREGESPGDVAAAHAARRAAWRQRLASGEVPGDASVEHAAPEPLGPVVRIYDPDGATLDLATGLACRQSPQPPELRRFILSRLPVPQELLE